MPFDASEALDDRDSSPDLENTSDVDAGSSSAKDERTLLDVLQEVVGTDSSSDAGGEEADGGEGEADAGLEGDAEGASGQEGDRADDAADEDETEQARVQRLLEELRDEKKPLHKVERFLEVNARARQADEFETELNELRPLREQIGQIADAAQRTGLSEDDLTTLFAFPVLFRDDPSKAIQNLEAFLESRKAASGLSLPEDIRSAVEDGEMTEARAVELAQARAAAARVQRESEYESTRRAQQESADRQTQSRARLQEYQQTLRSSDPDYTTAAQRWHYDRLVVLAREKGAPETPEQALELAQQAWADVKAQMAEFKPKREPRPAGPSGRRPTSASAPAPKNMLEAVSAAVGGVTED